MRQKQNINIFRIKLYIYNFSDNIYTNKKDKNEFK